MRFHPRYWPGMPRRTQRDFGMHASTNTTRQRNLIVTNVFSCFWYSSTLLSTFFGVHLQYPKLWLVHEHCKHSSSVLFLQQQKCSWSWHWSWRTTSWVTLISKEYSDLVPSTFALQLNRWTTVICAQSWSLGQLTDLHFDIDCLYTYCFKQLLHLCM